jgi:hypothetical protein
VTPTYPELAGDAGDDPEAFTTHRFCAGWDPMGSMLLPSYGASADPGAVHIRSPYVWTADTNT